MAIEQETRRPAAASVPPTPQSLPYLGTTWVERGAVYWVRRVGFACVNALLLLVLMFTGGVAVAIVLQFHLSHGVQTGVFVGMGAMVMVGFGHGPWAYARDRKLGNEELAARRSVFENRWPWRTLLPYLRTRGGAQLAGLLTMPVSAPLAVGAWLAVCVTNTFGRDTDAERRARARWELDQAGAPTVVRFGQ